MMIAFIYWKNRIASVFDTASQILIIKTESKKIVEKYEETLPESSFYSKLKRLKELDINVVVCGAISRPMHEQILENNINVISFVSGELDDVIQAWFNNELEQSKYLMPGCCEQRRNRGNGRGNRGNKKYAESGTIFGFCICPKCGHKESHKRGVPCVYIECPNCGIAMKRQ